MIALIRTLTLPATYTSRFGDLCRACAHTVARRGLLSLVDQVVVSGTSFLTTIILGRTCLPAELGLYAIGFNLGVVLLGIPKALIWTPYTTFCPGMPENDRRWYSGSTLAHQALLSTLAAVVIACIGGIMCRLGDVEGLGSMLLVLGPAIGLMLLREHVRRVCFSRLQVGEALAVDTVVAVLQVSGMLVLAATGLLTAARAYVVIGVACLPVIAVWIVANRRSLAIRHDRMLSDLAMNWQFARWLFSGACSMPRTTRFIPGCYRGCAARRPWACCLLPAARSFWQTR